MWTVNPWKIMTLIAGGVLAGNITTLIVIKICVDTWWHYKVTTGR